MILQQPGPGILCRSLFSLRTWLVLLLVFAHSSSALATAQEVVPLHATPIRVGASVVDVSPQKFPIAVNGGFTAQMATQVHSPVKARAIVIDADEQQFAIVVVDSCMMPRQLLDETKQMAQQATGIAADKLMIAATHTHSAPAVMSCLGTDADPDYQPFLRIKIVEAIGEAKTKLQPARVGWGEIDAANYMAIRRWILRSDRIQVDPFGESTVRANMHAGRDWDNVVGESGPEDPTLSLVAFQTLDGQPLAVLSNLSMHYFSGQPPVSADYFGIYCDGLEQRLAASSGRDPNGDPTSAAVALMSHGCSGDVWRMDYTKRTPESFSTISMDDYTDGLLDLALKAYEAIEYSDEVVVAMAERRLPLKYRVPDEQRLQWARQVLSEVGDRLPQTQQEVYAREQIHLHELQQTEVVLQTLRLGNIGIVTTPTETYALTGLKIKLQSPLAHTMVLDLANGGDGYIPPPEQHLLGGYNTWPARSAGLEVDAEPKMVAAALEMLESVTNQPRREYQQSRGTAVEDTLRSKPLAYFRLDEFSGSIAHDSSGNQRHGTLEPGVAFFLQGPHSDRFNTDGEINRCVHFTGGNLQCTMDPLPGEQAISMWIWNGMPDGARDVAGWFYCRCGGEANNRNCEQLGLSGKGELMLQVGDATPALGRFKVERWTWTNVRIERSHDQIQVFVNGLEEPDIRVAAPAGDSTHPQTLYFGGSPHGIGWEGRMDEITIFVDEK